jgi:CRISPR-associated protein Csb2
MFALRVTYLTGRVYSAVFSDGDTRVEPEWPPHPSRLFSALVSAWGEGGAEAELRPALDWLRQQEAPQICAGEATARRLVEAYVPVNDVLALPKKALKKLLLPEDRSRKPRTFPSASLTSPDVYFVWPAEPPGELLLSLKTILRRTCSIGHSASLVAVEIAPEVPESRDHTVWIPNSVDGQRMRITSPGRLEELVESFARFERNPSKTNRPSAGASTLYSYRKASAQPAALGAFGRMIVFRRVSGPRGGLVSTLSLTAALRGAFMKFAPQPAPEFISGHALRSSEEQPTRSERPHLAFVPLPFTGFPHSTGDVMGLAVLLPRTLSPEEEEVCWTTAGEISELVTKWGKWNVEITDAEEQKHTLLPETWSNPASVWSTVTPLVFDRFPKDPYGAEAEQTVRNAFIRVGVPEPDEIELHYNPWHEGVPKAPYFPAAPGRPGKPRRYHCHVMVRFDRPIAGPVVAGAGRFYGYGLFRQHFQHRGAK